MDYRQQLPRNEYGDILKFMVYSIWKYGDLDEGKIYSGMFAGYYDPKEWNHTAEQELKHYSSLMKTVFFIMVHDDRFKPVLQQLCASIGEEVEDINYRRTPGYIDYKAIKLLIGDQDLETKLASQNPYEIVNADSINFNEQLILDSTKRDFYQEIKDFNVVTSGSYTVGTGKNYSDWGAARADTGNQTGNLTMTQETDCTITTDGIFIQTVGAYDFTMTTDTAHLGKPTSGRITSINMVTGLGYNNLGANTGSVYVSELNLKNIWTSASAGNCFRNRSTADVYVENVIIDGGGYNKHGYWTQQVTANATSKNIIIFNVGSVYEGFRIAVATTLDHCFAYSCASQGFDLASQASTLNNCAAFDCGTDFLNHGSATGNNNASTDATAANGNWGTGADNFSSLTAANEVESLTSTDADFLQPSPGSNIADGGTPVGGDDIAGNAWDATAPSIGVFQIISAAVGTIIPKILHLMRLRRVA